MKLTDTDQMPFGKYGTQKGDPRMMQDVPASYFFWLWTEGGAENEDTPVSNYIRENLDALEDEYPDGEWR